LKELQKIPEAQKAGFRRNPIAVVDEDCWSLRVSSLPSLIFKNITNNPLLICHTAPMFYRAKAALKSYNK